MANGKRPMIIDDTAELPPMTPERREAIMAWHRSALPDMVPLPKRPKSKRKLGPIEAERPKYNSLLEDARILRLSRGRR